MTAAIVRGSVPRAMRTDTPSISISTAAGAARRRRLVAVRMGAAGTGSTATGTNADGAFDAAATIDAPPASAASRASRRHANSWLDANPCRRATSDTVPTPEWLSATTAALSPADQRRRCPAPVKTSIQRVRPEAIGAIGYSPSQRGDDGRFRLHTVCGLLMHSSLAITPEGLPLGLAAIRFWSRAKFKGTAALKRHVNPTRVPIEAKESMRWLENMRGATALLGDADRLIHIGDRENDIYEFFCATRDAGTHFFSGIKRAATKALDRLEAASALKDLQTAGLHLEKLKADREGQFSIRINLQWRVCFVWRDGENGPSEVEIVDYH